MEHVGPGAFPAGILVLLTALSLVLIVQGFRRSPCWHFGKEKLLEIERSLRFLRRRTAGLGAAMGTYAKEGGFASACCASG